MHSAQACVVVLHSMPLGLPTQSLLVLQPAWQVVSAQYCAIGQLSIAGRHSTHVSFAGSQRGVGTLQSVSWTHCTQVPLVVLQTCPEGQPPLASQPWAQTFAWQMLPAGQSALPRQATHVMVVGLHLGLLVLQSESLVQLTHACVARSHTLPIGHVLVPSHPSAQPPATQRCPAAQSEDVRQPTQAPPELHLCPVGQSWSVTHPEVPSGAWASLVSVAAPVEQPRGASASPPRKSTTRANTTEIRGARTLEA